RNAVDAEARGGRLPSGHVDRLRRPAAYAAVARCPAQGDGVAAGREPIERDATCSTNGLTAPAGHTDRVAARLVRARGGRADRDAAGERNAADAEARGGRLPSGHVDRLRRPAAYAAVARCPAEGDGVAPGHEPIERDATCSPNGLTAPAGHADRVAARLVRARGGSADREAAGRGGATDREGLGGRLVGGVRKG